MRSGSEVGHSSNKAMTKKRIPGSRRGQLQAIVKSVRSIIRAAATAASASLLLVLLLLYCCFTAALLLLYCCFTAALLLLLLLRRRCCGAAAFAAAVAAAAFLCFAWQVKTLPVDNKRHAKFPNTAKREGDRPEVIRLMSIGKDGSSILPPAQICIYTRIHLAMYICICTYIWM